MFSHLEASHNEGDDDIPLLVGELPTNGEQHEHVVAGHHAHGVQVTQHIRTRNPPLPTGRYLQGSIFRVLLWAWTYSDVFESLSQLFLASDTGI